MPARAGRRQRTCVFPPQDQAGIGFIDSALNWGYSLIFKGGQVARDAIYMASWAVGDVFVEGLMKKGLGKVV